MPYDPVQTFLQEADELISDIEQCALNLASDEDHEETVHRLFRAFHTIKGSGAMCGLDALAAFTHHVESLLEEVRAGKIAVTAPLTELVLKATDHIKLFLSAAHGGDAVPGHDSDSLIAAIAQFMDLKAATPTVVVESPANESETEWRIEFRPSRDLLANGANPAALLQDLRDLGACEITAHTDEIPPLDALEAHECYVWWSIKLRTDAGENAIRDVFIFVDTDGLKIQQAENRRQDDAGQSVVVETSAAVASPATRQPVAREATVRVPAERLDRLVNLVGEFVMTQSCLAQAAAQNGDADLINPVQILERLVSELRDNVLGIRMLPIGSLFGRFRRVVHDLSAELGKDVDLVTEGAETELDKSILDQLSEPLVHCLRNCMDHGIEPAAAREERGKPGRATIRLSAVHTGSNVVIGIEDDGRGIDRQAVFQKALEKGLVSPDANLSEAEIIELILLPGFSTATQVTSVSGRGVGMDAVKRQIEHLRGTLGVESRPGKGTRVSITLPLTLAIIDGLLFTIGEERFIIPMSAVRENVELQRNEKARNNGRNVTAVRGELVPYIDLRTLFGIAGDAPEIEKVVIVAHQETRVGLVVDRVVGTHQTVIQSLGRFYRNVKVASGATVMGDGRIALILDLARLIHYADSNCRMRTTESNFQKNETLVYS